MDLQLYDSQQTTKQAQKSSKTKQQEYNKDETNAKQLKLQETRNKLQQQEHKNLQHIPHLNNNHFHYVEHRTYYNYYQPHCLFYPHQHNKLDLLEQNYLPASNKMYPHPINSYNNNYGYNYSNEHFFNGYNNSLSVDIDEWNKNPFNSYFNCNNEIKNTNLLTLSSPDKLQKTKQQKLKNKTHNIDPRYNYLNDLNGKSSEEEKDEEEEEEEDEDQDEKQVSTTKTGYVDSTTVDSEGKQTKDNSEESIESKPNIDSCGRKKQMKEISENFCKENAQEFNFEGPLKNQQYFKKQHKGFNSEYLNKNDEDNNVKTNKYNNTHNNLQPAWQWMKKTVYPTVPSTGMCGGAGWWYELMVLIVVVLVVSGDVNSVMLLGFVW